MEIIISINPPYTDMIMKGYKNFEFRNLVLKGMEEGHYSEIIKAYIYETKNKGGVGKIIGEVIIGGAYCPLYNKSVLDPTALVEERYQFIKAMYYDWCEIKGLKPNHKEGWFKSKKFRNYREEIGFLDSGSFLPNYALILGNAFRYEESIGLNCFKNTKGEVMKLPPQNMCYVENNDSILKEKDNFRRK